jgi:N utilization substance protein A
MSIIEDVFRSMLIKKYGSDKNFDIIVNPDKGDIEIWQNRKWLMMNLLKIALIMMK